MLEAQSGATFKLPSAVASAVQAYYRFNASCKEGEVAEAQPPLVLLIGMGSAMSDWGGSFLQKLRAAMPCGREILALEWRGAGLSTDFSDQPLTYYSMADGVLQLLDALHMSGPVDILGMSTGGDIALLLAALHPERVGRLIGIGAMAGSKYTVLPDLTYIFDPASFANLTQAQQLAVLFPPQNETFFKQAVCAFVASLMSLPDFMTQVNATVMEGQYLADNNFTSVDSTVWDRLPSITQPVLLLDGSLDTPVPPINARLIAGQLPDARVLYFDGWGHGLMVKEAGSRLAAITAQFLGGSEPPGAFAVQK
ncbi:Alpha beta hydrolase fold [Chlorella sorokiniana]|uniref:Alpha beta hydrolase fold n=1 Tax=Chlorella sorokiniana TaxID=3076 RepID=A0A2P6U1S6_CHLSO|nr:Alpha beta hydrolase fold [Chlorella sorokiniana]|eukprot:PRW60265.1 Alpha beta hydrolase fold [Chlorella sorokiniana]